METLEHVQGGSMEVKRKRKLGLTIVDSFDYLRNSNELQRVDAGTFLIKTLSGNIKSGEGGAELAYVLKRLVYGMGSMREASCAGFFSTLVALLTAVPSITVSEMLKLLEGELSVSEKLQKSEEADIYFGQILVLGTLIRSGRFVDQASREQQRQILAAMLEAGEKRSYLRLAAYTFILELVKQEDSELFQEVVWPVVVQELGKPLKSQSLEGLYFLLVVRSSFPEFLPQEFLLEQVGFPDLLDEDTAEIWGRLLLESPAATYAKHPVYEELARQLAASPRLPELWSRGVEPWLATPSANRHHVAFQLLSVILANIADKNNVSQLLTPNLVAILLRHMKSKEDRNMQLAEQAGDVLALIVNTFSNGEQDSDDAILGVLDKLLFCPGTLMFEKVTGTRIVQILSGELRAEGMKRLAQRYEDVVTCRAKKARGPDGKVAPWLNGERVYAAQLLTRLMCSQVVQTETEWKINKLKFLLHLGMFKTENFGHQLIETLRNCFFKVIDQPPKSTLPRLNSVRNILSSVVSHANKLLKNSGVDSLRHPWTEKVHESWKAMIKVVKKMKPGKEESDSPVIPVFHTMFLHMGLQLFVKPDNTIEALQELHSCYEEIGQSRPRPAGGRDDEVQWVDVAVDLMLSLLSRNTHLLRNMVGWVFPHLCPFLTPWSLNTLLQVLDPASEEHPLLDSLSADEDEEGSAGDSSDGDGSGSSEGEEEGVSDSEQDNDEPANAKLQMAVREALGAAGTVTDTESVDLDNLDEEEGNRLNEALSKAFRQFRQFRRPGKGSKAARKQTRRDRALTHFRIRALDLLEMYIAAGPGLEACLRFVPPLFRLLEFSIQDEHQRPLEARVRSCVAKLARLRRWAPSPGVTESQLAAVASGLLDKGERKSTVVLDMNTQVMECCMFLARVSHQLNSQDGAEKKKTVDGSPLTSVFKNAAIEFFQKRDSLLHPGFFKTLTQQMWFGNWNLVPLYVECCFAPNTRVFKRSQAIAMVTCFFNNRLVQQTLTQEEKDCLLNLEKAIMQHTLQLLREVAAGSTVVRDKFVGELVQLVATVWNLRARQGAAADWRAVGLAFVEYKRSVSTVAGFVKHAIKRLALSMKLQPGVSFGKHSEEPMAKVRKMENEEDSAIGTESSGSDHEDREENKKRPVIPQTAGGSRDPGNVEGDGKNGKKRKKFKRKSDLAHQKKESKLLRAAAASDGLELVSFASVDVGSIAGHSVDSENKTDGSGSENKGVSSNFRKSKKKSKR
ncbi:myb-binding protein 1A [Bacillus rossius redtenbacheri]|uniref:myb-binding protein 1A n=1 Tax=Bacillus rossius redtenbacheri TaxID=93214 RepID=UPI002FDEEB68